MCSGGGKVEQSEAESEQTASDSNELERSVVINGSGTVYPLMAKLAEEYMLNEQEQVSVEVSRAGTSANFKKFLEVNGTDFNNALRQIKEKEIAQAEELGLEIKELKVALDGLTFVIKTDANDDILSYRSTGDAPANSTVYYTLDTIQSHGRYAVLCCL